MSRIILALAWFSSALSAQTLSTVRPGLLYYGEGVVVLNGVHVAEIRPADAYLEEGRAVETADGRAELLMGPGSIVRLGRRTRMEFVSGAPAAPVLKLRWGIVMVEIVDPPREPLTVRAGDADVLLRRRGSYRIEAAPNSAPKLIVLRGKADAELNGASLSVGRRRASTLKGAAPKAERYAEDADPFELWAAGRSRVLADERKAAAPEGEALQAGVPASNDTEGQEPSTEELIRIIRDRANR